MTFWGGFVLTISFIFPPGTYQPQTGQGSCAVCPKGSYCDPYELGNVTGVIAPPDCVPGHYCPNGTRYAEQNKCPAGTYSNQTALAREGRFVNKNPFAAVLNF